MRLTLWVLAGAALCVAGAGSAAVTVIGAGLARECFLAAELNAQGRQALAVCDRALGEEAMKPRDRAATHVNRGIIQMRDGRHAAALADHERAVRMAPRLAEAHVNRGIALVHLRRPAEAVDALTRGLSLGASRPEVAHYARAVAHELQGDATAAYRDYRAAAALKPNWAEPAEQLRRFRVQPAPARRHAG